MVLVNVYGSQGKKIKPWWLFALMKYKLVWAVKHFQIVNETKSIKVHKGKGNPALSKSESRTDSYWNEKGAV